MEEYTKLFKQPIIHNVDEPKTEESLIFIIYIYIRRKHIFPRNDKTRIDHLFIVSFDIQRDHLHSFYSIETVLCTRNKISCNF